MNHTGHGAHAGHRAGQSSPRGRRELTRLAVTATAHCLIGCAIGEILGLVIGTALGLSTVATIVLAIALAFVFGYSFTIVAVLRSGLALGAAAGTAFAAGTVSITIMAIVDNAIMLVIPGALDAGLGSWLFLGSARRLGGGGVRGDRADQPGAETATRPAVGGGLPVGPQAGQDHPGPSPAPGDGPGGPATRTCSLKSERPSGLGQRDSARIRRR